MMNINLEFTQPYYSIIYQIAFLGFIIILLSEGLRRHYPLSSWLLIVAFTSSFFIIGSKLGTIPFEVLRAVCSAMPIREAGNKSAVMGGLLGLLAIWAVKKWFRFDAPLADIFAFALPFLMLVQRVGCLLAGCCFGVCTSQAWGVRYAGAGILRDKQMLFGLIHQSENETLGVHPVPIYFMLGTVSTLLLLWWLRSHLKQSGSLLLLSLWCMSVVRFITEFFRDPFTNHQLGEIVAGLQLVQWLSLFFVLLWGIMLWRNEQKKSGKRSNSIIQIDINRNMSVALLLSLLIFSLRNWFVTEEKIVLSLLIVSAVLAQVYHFWQSNQVLSYRLATFSLLIISLGLMSQTHIQGNEIETTSDSIPKSSSIKSRSFSAHYNSLNLSISPPKSVVNSA